MKLFNRIFSITIKKHKIMKKQLEISLEMARELYSTSNQVEFKKMLEANFTKEELIGDITHLIKSFDDVLGYNKKHKSSFYDEYITNKSCGNDFSVAFLRLKMLEFALNEGERPKLGERRYYPYFEVKRAGLVFFSSHYGSDFSCGSVSYFKNEKLATYAGKNFTSLFKDFLK
jgi:hypothetical protein